MDAQNYLTQLYSLWTTQDTLLQGYRSMFLTTESLLIAVAVTLLATSPNANILPLILLGVIVIYVWRLITRQRSRDVSFVQHLILSCEEGKYVENPFSTFKDYQKSWLNAQKYQIDYINSASEDFDYKGVFFSKGQPFIKWGTRKHMEVTLPLIYFCAWVFYRIQLEMLANKYLNLTRSALV